MHESSHSVGEPPVVTWSAREGPRRCDNYHPPPPPPPELLLLPPPPLLPLLEEGFDTPAAIPPAADAHAPLAPAPPNVPPPPVHEVDAVSAGALVPEREPIVLAPMPTPDIDLDALPKDLNHRSIFGPSPNASR
jgi:hypothetical protein